jgi:hypothetical protein
METSNTLTEEQLALIAGAIDERLQTLMSQVVDIMIREWVAPVGVTVTVDAPNHSTRIDKL